MFITIYKKIKNEELYLIRFELTGNKWRKWRGKENRVMRPSKWNEYDNDAFHTGKARASLSMFKNMNKLIEKGYSIYKKKSKKIKTIKPIIKIRKLNLNIIKKLYDEGHFLYFVTYAGILAIQKKDGFVYNNFSHKKLIFSGIYKKEFGYYLNNKFIPFSWKNYQTLKELEVWLNYNTLNSKPHSVKIIVKINNMFYT